MSTTIIRRFAAGAIALAGVLHLVLVPEYLSEKPYIGILFLLSVPLTAAAAVLLWSGNSRIGWALGGLTAAGMLAGFVASRTIGLPAYNPSDWAEGIPSMAAEVLFLLLALRAQGRQTDERPSWNRAWSGFPERSA